MGFRSSPVVGFLGMRILVTGNHGYIGPVVGAHLARAIPEAELVGLDASLFAGCLPNPIVWPDRAYRCQLMRDVRDVTAADLKGFDAIVHLAAISNDPMGNVFERPTTEINRDGSLRLAAAAKEAGVRRFVFASSCSVYGAGASDARTEQDEVAPLTAYARSKVDTERGLATLADDRFIVTCLRFATACGMSPRLRLDLVLNDFVASALVTGTIKILSDGTPWRPLIHVDDMARAIEWALIRPSDPSCGVHVVVNTGSNDWNYQVRQLADAVADELGNVGVEVNPSPAPDKRSYRVDFSLYQRIAPSHQPQVTLGLAIAGLLAGIRDSKVDASFRTGPYIRLHVLANHVQTGRLDEHLRWT